MNRNFGLDFIRTIAIWLVLLQHAGVTVRGLAPIKIGGVGVEIFFVLSGFLIGGILFKNLSYNKPFFTTFWNFWRRRWLRILPLYYLVLIVKFVFIDNSVGANIFYYFFFLQNNFYGISFLGVSWSLVIEEWFYIFPPIYLFFVTRYIHSNKKIMLLLVLFVVFINICRFLYVHYTNTPYGGINSNFSFRFDSLFLGVILAFMKFNKMEVYNSLQNVYVFLLGLVLFLMYLYWIIQLNTTKYIIDSLIFPRTIGFFILPFTIALMVPFVELFSEMKTNTKINKVFFSFITYTSLFTYALYLIHPFYYSFVQSKLFLGMSIFSKHSLAIIFTYITAYLVYNFFERPILNLRNKVTY